MLLLLLGSFLIMILMFFTYKFNHSLVMISGITIIYSLFAFYQLGSFKMPSTYYSPENANEEVVINNSSANLSFDQIYIFSGEGENTDASNYEIYYRNSEILGSEDGENYQLLAKLDQKEFAKYTIINLDQEYSYPYLKIVFKNTNAIINEFALLDSKSNEFKELKLAANQNEDYQNMIDEQDQITIDPTYYSETFFDEIYHVRNALEIANGQFMYAHVHPLLGTSLIALGIKIFGFNPFGFRVMGTLFSILMLPLIFNFSQKIFKKVSVASFSTILFAADFMHYTTGRIATLEPFSIFFIILMYYLMYNYLQIDFKVKNTIKIMLNLAAIGFTMSLAWATKWTGIYASIGIVILYFYQIIINFKKENYQLIIKVILSSFIFFVFLPAFIYILVYSWCHFTVEWPNSFLELSKNVLNQIIYMFDYHANLESTHPFQSTWYMWLLDIRPIWYYVKHVNDSVSSISCFNNPLISWMGLFSLFYLIYDYFKSKNKLAIFILLAYLSQLLPWVFVTRCVFAYHYYPSIPFLILAITYFFNSLIQKNPKYLKSAVIYLFLVVFLFIMFFPAISGIMVSQNYIKSFLVWFKSWNLV